MTTEVDVLVVGAGPGGSAAAYHLARHGVDVLLVDKGRFPREKVCGDGFTPRGVRAMQDLGVDPTEPGFTRIDGLRVYRGSRPLLELRWPDLNDFPAYGVVRTRHDFDDLLVQRAVKAGAVLWEETEALGPIIDGGWVTGANVRRDRDPDAEPETVRAKVVIAADGASSRFGGQAGVERDGTRPLGIAARRYYTTTRDIGPWFESWLEMQDDEGRSFPGYGWIFPVGEGRMNVGAGLLNTFVGFKDLSAKRVFDVFGGMLSPEFEVTPEHEDGPVLSGPLPMGFNRRPSAQPGLLLVGDAGGVVNPFNGEGIAFAMDTGKLAAELVYGSLATGRQGLAQIYPAMLQKQYGQYYWIGRKFVGALGHPEIMRFATRYGLPRRGVMKFLLKLMTGLTDGKEGDWQDRLLHVLERIAPAA